MTRCRCLILNCTHDEFRNLGGGFLSAGGEAGPVVKIDYAYFAVGTYDAVATVDIYVENFSRSIA